MFVIGITGGIGSGKSLAAQVCKSYDVPVVDADEISRNVTNADGQAMEEIVTNFGNKMMMDDGSLNRQRMSELVFKDKNALDKLSGIVHRYVIEEISHQVALYKERKQKVLVLDVPIPVKIGFLDVCDQVWVVWADDPLRIKRLSDRGMPEKEAIRRIHCQMNREEYEMIADILIANNSTEDDFRESVSEILERECKMRGIKISKLNIETK